MTVSVEFNGATVLVSLDILDAVVKLRVVIDADRAVDDIGDDADVLLVQPACPTDGFPVVVGAGTGGGGGASGAGSTLGAGGASGGFDGASRRPPASRR